jgi:hypothetical protein
MHIFGWEQTLVMKNFVTRVEPEILHDIECGFQGDLLRSRASGKVAVSGRRDTRARNPGHISGHIYK